MRDILTKQRPASGPITVLALPTKLAVEMLEGVRALDEGETPAIFRPSPTRRHGLAYTLRKLRRLAIYHVHAIASVGESKGAAEARVAEAYGVSVDALRSWQKRERKEEPDTLQYVIEEAYSDGWAPEVFDEIHQLIDCATQYRQALKAGKIGKGKKRV